MSKERKKKEQDFSGELEEIATNDLEQVTPKFKDVIYREWLPRIYAALLGAVKEIPQQHREYVLGKQGKACWDFSKSMLGFHEGMSWEEFKMLNENLPAPIGWYEFIELGNDMTLWKYHCSKNKDGRAMCWCPIALLDLLPGIRKAAGDSNPFPELCCGCSTSLMVNSIEECCNRKVARFDTICTVQTATDASHEEDRFIVNFKPMAHSKECISDDSSSNAKSQ